MITDPTLQQTNSLDYITKVGAEYYFHELKDKLEEKEKGNFFGIIKELLIKIMELANDVSYLYFQEIITTVKFGLLEEDCGWKKSIHHAQ